MVHPGGELPGLRSARVPHGAHPPPLRAGGLARDHGDRALLDPRRALRRPRARASSTPTSCRSRDCTERHVASGRILVYGLGVSGRATAARLLSEGVEVVAVDDDAGDGPRRAAAGLGVELVSAPDAPRARGAGPHRRRDRREPGGARRPPRVLVGPATFPSWARSSWRGAGRAARSWPSPGTNGKTTVTTLGAGHARGLGAQGGGGRQHRPAPARRRGRGRRGGGGRGVVVPAGPHDVVPSRRGGLAELLGRPPRLARHGRRLPRRQGQAVGQQRPRRRGRGQRRGPRGAGGVGACPGPGGPRCAPSALAQGDYTRAGPARSWAPTGPPWSEVASSARTMPHDLVDALCALADRPGGGGEPRGLPPGAARRFVGSPTASSWSARLTGCGSTTTPRRPRPVPCSPPWRGAPRPC